MLKKIVTASIISTLALAASAFAADGWETAIKVKVATAEAKVRIGMRSDATDAIDGRYDVPAYVAGNEALLVYSSLAAGKYWRDIRAICADACAKLWTIGIESTQTGKTVVLSWDAASLPADLKISLTDSSTSTVIDMKTQTSYQYEHHATRQIVIDAVR